MMEIHETEIGFEDEEGNLVGLKKEWAILNVYRHPKFKTPILKKIEGCT